MKYLAMALSLTSAIASAHDFTVEATFEDDTDGAYAALTQVQYKKYGVGVAVTQNQTSPVLSYDWAGVYLNKLPYLFFDKTWEVGENTTVSATLNSLDYEHTDEYNKNLWFGGVSAGHDFVLTEKDTIAVDAGVIGVNDSNWRSTARVNYVREIVEGTYGLVKYKNVLNSQPNDYYYSPKYYNSIQLGVMQLMNFGDNGKVRASVSAGVYEAKWSEGSAFTSEVNLVWSKTDEFSVFLNGKFEQDYSYAGVGVKFNF